MKSRTRKHPHTDPEFAYEMMKRRTRQLERIPMYRYINRSKYRPNELPLYPKSIREDIKAINNA